MAKNTEPKEQDKAKETTTNETKEQPKQAAQARAVDAVAYPVVTCCGCNSTDTVRIDEHLKLEFHKRKCRQCGKTFKEPAR